MQDWLCRCGMVGTWCRESLRLVVAGRKRLCRCDRVGTCWRESSRAIGVGRKRLVGASGVQTNSLCILHAATHLLKVVRTREGLFFASEKVIAGVIELERVNRCHMRTMVDSPWVGMQDTRA